ncbi:hypothetical protein M1247_05915 [Mycobacterium sp. 21AC1]|uniref:hypothetical protein n=1 Tax=[Mycobacterium] appelbergii TaxID=2939269 RepID=UPI00293933E3|nr:hypothetical protein [Mycobacterium sp. 21AC1]MDV3124440.1 hypothetical protein [Mycobacterium sp. 21AC1]
MNATQKIAGFTAVLAVVFAGALGLGAVLGPESPPAAAGHTPAAGQDGYTLELAESITTAGVQKPLRFRITDPSGSVVTKYVDSHEKALHLIVVRRDLVGYQHVHPVLDAAGTWSVPLDLREGGDYRVFADFVPAGGDGQTLGADLHVAGDYRPRPLPPADTTTTVDGYTVTLHGAPVPGEPAELTLSVSRDGRPVTDLQPYLGAYGHLVALRAADLAYLHLHPMGEPGDPATPAGPDIGFHTTFASAGEYRLFLDFKHEDVVRTAEFTLEG